MKAHKLHCKKLFEQIERIPLPPKKKKRSRITCKKCWLKGHREKKCPGREEVTKEELGKRKADYELERK